jgi:hypothetical protein
MWLAGTTYLIDVPSLEVSPFSDFLTRIAFVTKQPAHCCDIGTLFCPAGSRATECEDGIERVWSKGAIAEVIIDGGLHHELASQVEPLRSWHPVIVEMNSRSRKLNEQWE